MLNIYVIHAVLDNPLFDGVELREKDWKLLDFLPPDWRENYLTWEAKSLKATWPMPEAIGNVRKFNDLVYPRPLAFSQRAVDLLRDLLEPHGELLPVRHKLGTYYFYNCTRVLSCVDLTKSKTKVLKFPGGKRGLITDSDHLVFIDELLDEDLAIFTARTSPMESFCTQRFVDRVAAAGLQGFIFVPFRPLPEGRTYQHERYRLTKAAEKWKPKNMPALDIKSAAVMLRLYCRGKEATKKELAAAEEVMSYLEKALYNEDQTVGTEESYFGNVEGHKEVEHEIRVALSTPDCDRLVTHLLPSFRTLPWRGKYHVVKWRGEYADVEAPEEYVRLD